MRVLLPLCVVVSSTAYGLGLGPVLYTLLGEIFPSRAKDFCSPMSLAVRDLVAFVELKIFPWLVSVFGLSTMFFVHGAIGFVSCVIVFFFLPETRGLPLASIERLFSDDTDVAQKCVEEKKDAPAAGAKESSHVPTAA